MLQNRQIVRTVGNQIEYIVCLKDAITDFHSIVWMFIAVSVTIYRNAAAPSQRHQSTSSHCIMLTTKLLRSCIKNMSIVESFGLTAATLGGGFFVGILFGYALKKVIKSLAVILGLFLAVLAYLQYHQIANINWNKLQTVPEGVITTLSNVIVQMSAFGDSSHTATASLAMTSFGIPLTGSISAGFTIGFIKG